MAEEQKKYDVVVQSMGRNLDPTEMLWQDLKRAVYELMPAGLRECWGKKWVSTTLWRMEKVTQKAYFRALTLKCGLTDHFSDSQGSDLGQSGPSPHVILHCNGMH